MWRGNHWYRSSRLIHMYRYIRRIQLIHMYRSMRRIRLIHMDDYICAALHMQRYIYLSCIRRCSAWTNDVSASNPHVYSLWLVRRRIRNTSVYYAWRIHVWCVTYSCVMCDVFIEELLRACNTAPESSWMREFDPVYPLLFDLNH